jgi:hypothetical protein
MPVLPASGLAALAAAFVAAAPPAHEATVGPVPRALRSRLKLDAFYAKYADADGIPVVASAKVDDRALVVAARIVNRMLADQPEVRRALRAAKVRVAVIGRREETTDIPEYADLENKAYWNKRARGFGATRWRPAASCGEENLLGLPGDRYRGESILVHEFAHTMHELGLRKVDRRFDRDLSRAYEAATARGLWKRTYAGTNVLEYWAEGVQSYFNANRHADPTDGIHNGVSTRARLKKYDPELFALIDRAFHGSRWRWKPPAPPRTPATPRR